MLFSSIILHKQRKTDIPFCYCSPIILTYCPLVSLRCVLTMLPMDPAAIHLGLLSPQSDNGLYLDVLFWVMYCEHSCIHACMQAEKVPIHFHVSSRNTSPMKPYPKNIELYMCSVLIVWRINTTLLSLIYIPWSPASLGALWLSSLATGFQSRELRDNRSLYR